MFGGLGGEGQAMLAISLILSASALYIMGLMEGKIGGYFFVSGVFTHALNIILRGVWLGGIPLTEKHDNISFMAFSMALAYLYFQRRKAIRGLGITALPLISVMLLITVAYSPINTVSPFLKSPWFYIHMFFYFLSYGFFGISACIGLHYLREGEKEYEYLQYKSAIHGWIMLSISLFAGSIWFYFTYGTYWLWTSKELWVTLLWFYYGLYLHGRFIRGLSGRFSAALGALGFAVALFSYFGVGTVIKSPHTQF